MKIETLLITWGATVFASTHRKVSSTKIEFIEELEIESIDYTEILSRGYGYYLKCTNIDEAQECADILQDHIRSTRNFLLISIWNICNMKARGIPIVGEFKESLKRYIRQHERDQKK